MKVDNSIKPVNGNVVAENQTRTPRTSLSAGSGADEGGSVQLSTLSAELHAIETSLANTPVVDTSRVDQIKQAIAQGQFKVNPEAVADKLLDTVRQMIHSRAH